MISFNISMTYGAKLVHLLIYSFMSICGVLKDAGVYFVFGRYF